MAGATGLQAEQGRSEQQHDMANHHRGFLISQRRHTLVRTLLEGTSAHLYRPDNRQNREIPPNPQTFTRLAFTPRCAKPAMIQPVVAFRCTERGESVAFRSAASSESEQTPLRPCLGSSTEPQAKPHLPTKQKQSSPGYWVRNAMIDEETIRLDQFLKFAGAVGTGGEAKMRIQSGEVFVNGVVELRRRKQLRHGDTVQFEDGEYLVEFGEADDH